MQKPYTAAPARSKTKFLMSLTIESDIYSYIAKTPVSHMHSKSQVRSCNEESGFKIIILILKCKNDKINIYVIGAE